MRFRIIDTLHKTAAWNMAMDEVLLELADRAPPTIRFLSFSPHCALVGNFQSIEQEIRVQYCKENNIDINRRITGGGAIYFDESQLGWEIIDGTGKFRMNLQEMNEVFGNICAYALRKLGINAVFKLRNDVEVNGRKISGMGGAIYKGNVLFQGTLLVQDRIEKMLYTLKVPIEKLKQKEIDSVRERVTCIEYELGRIPEREELKNIFKDAFREKLGIEFYESELTEEEISLHNKYLPYYSSSAWIDKIKLPKNTQGLIKSVYRSGFGTVKVNAIVNTKQKMFRSILITGDFFEDKRKILDFERIIKNVSINKININETIKKYFDDEEEKECFKGCFDEIFRKIELLKLKFSPKEVNKIFTVNIEDIQDFYPEVFLLPYCSKKSGCVYRRKNDCQICGECNVGEAYKFSYDFNLEPITILTFENLLDNFKKMKRKGIKDYIGSCCEAFFVKHQEEFRNSGLRGILLDIESSTCYELGKAKEAYYGRFESETSLNLRLIKKVLNIIFKGEKKIISR